MALVSTHFVIFILLTAFYVTSYCLNDDCRLAWNALLDHWFSAFCRYAFCNNNGQVTCIMLRQLSCCLIAFLVLL